MFVRLDSRYGRPEKLVDCVLNDLKKLKRINDGEDMKFISMVDTVEKLMPPTQKREWALKRHRNNPIEFSSRFQPLMEFLLEERFAMDYMHDDLRSSNSTRNQCDNL